MTSTFLLSDGQTIAIFGDYIKSLLLIFAPSFGLLSRNSPSEGKSTMPKGAVGQAVDVDGKVKAIVCEGECPFSAGILGLSVSRRI
jgi:hypothetical protein